MLVKIRLRSGPRVQPKGRKNQHAALALASLLTPAAMMADVLAGWRLLADLNIARTFPITEGFYSHWQVWVVAAAVLHLGAILLNRYGKRAPVVQKTIGEPERNLANSRL
jgi:hypothetical protein